MRAHQASKKLRGTTEQASSGCATGEACASPPINDVTMKADTESESGSVSDVDDEVGGDFSCHDTDSDSRQSSSDTSSELDDDVNDCEIPGLKKCTNHFLQFLHDRVKRDGHLQ